MYQQPIWVDRQGIEVYCPYSSLLTTKKGGDDMAALLAIASATTFGVADFLGGLASRRTHVLVIAALSQFAGLAVLAVVLPLSGVAPTAAAMAWGAAAGIAGAGGLVFYFRALAIGPMGVTAPVAAVVGAALPVGVGVAMGERPGPLAVVGVVLGVVAVALASRPAADDDHVADGDAPDLVTDVAAGMVARADDGLAARSETLMLDGTPEVTLTAQARLRAGLLAALAAGLAFGAFFVTLAAAPDSGGLWPLLGARIAGLALLGVLLLRRRPGVPDGRAIAIGLVSGLLDMTANVLFLLATQTGMLVLVAVLASLYPVGVVLLARAVLRERLAPLQWVGIGAAVAATVLIAA